MEQPKPPGPTRLGRYTLIEPLGEGGMAKVFVAQKDGATDVCVLKQLHVQLEQNSEAAKRFIREANIASQLQHPGIAKIVDAGMEDGRFCLAMEFIAGQTVEAMVKKAKEKGGILPLEISIPIVLHSLEALSYAHDLADPVDKKRLGIVHRDLSPRNIMLSYGGMVKLIDFGIAKGDVDEYKTAAGVLMGTPYYMSPEQARAQPVDLRSDIYTLAAVFFEMLTGKRLVQAKGRAKILMTVARQIAPPVSSVNPNVPKSLDPILAKALAKDPAERYENAEAFAAALRLQAGEAAFTKIEILGDFLRDLFPEGEAKAYTLITRARAMMSDAPPVEATRVAGADVVMPSDLSVPSDVGGKTRTGYLDPNAPLMVPEVQHFTSPANPYPEVYPFDPANTTNLVSARTTLPPRTSPLAKIAPVVLGILILLVGGMFYRLQSSTPESLDAVDPGYEQPPRITTKDVVPRAVVEPPPPPVAPPPPAPPPVAPKKERARAPSPPPPPPPAGKAQPKSPYAPFRARLAKIRQSGNKEALWVLYREMREVADREKSNAAKTHLGRVTRTNVFEDQADALQDALDALD